MIKHTFPIVAALFVVLLAGCSKHVSESTPVKPRVTNLGTIEVSDGIPIHRDLSHGRACVITPTITNGDYVRLTIAIIQTNSAGVAQTLATPEVQNRADQPMAVSVGDIGIHLTPQTKP